MAKSTDNKSVPAGRGKNKKRSEVTEEIRKTVDNLQQLNKLQTSLLNRLSKKTQSL